MLIALIVFLDPLAERYFEIAGTQLLLTKAPAIPPTITPKQIISMQSGINLIGPEPNIETANKQMPQDTSLLKFLLFSGIKLRQKLVRVYVIVSRLNMIPTTKTGSSLSLICRSGSLNVRHISEKVMHSAVASTGNFFKRWKNPSSGYDSVW